MAIERILVPVDFSTVSMQALEYAIDFAQPLDAEIVVLFVVEQFYYATPADLYGPSVNVGMIAEEHQRAGRAQLEQLSKQLAKRKVRARTVMLTGTPYQGIVSAAKRVKADLIVMATHGRTGLTRMLIGSTAERVVRTAACPVLTVHGYRRGRTSGKARKSAKKSR